MKEPGIDLHCHSTASDGTLSPTALVRLAQRNSLAALALTDHDTTAGINEAAKEAMVVGMEFLPGIEISAEYHPPGTLHILGYGIDPASPALARFLERLRAGREQRNRRIIARLNEMGIDVTLEAWRIEARDGVLGRPHLAAILVRGGHAVSLRDAFDRFIGETAPAHFDKEHIPAADAFAAISAAGGVSVLAHPCHLKCDFPHLEELVRQWVDQGLDGIEVLHSDHDEEMVRFLDALAGRLNLLKTGGSDFHGANKPDIELGRSRERPVPRSYYDDLVRHLKHSREGRGGKRPRVP